MQAQKSALVAAASSISGQSSAAGASHQQSTQLDARIDTKLREAQQSDALALRMQHDSDALRAALAQMPPTLQATSRGPGGIAGSMQLRAPPARAGGGHRRARTEGGAAGRTSPLSNLFSQARDASVSIAGEIPPSSSVSPDARAAVSQPSGVLVAPQNAHVTAVSVRHASDANEPTSRLLASSPGSVAGSRDASARNGGVAAAHSVQSTPAAGADARNAYEATTSLAGAADTPKNTQQLQQDERAESLSSTTLQNAGHAARAGALAAIAAARKQAIALQTAADAEQLMHGLDTEVAVAEEAQTQLAMAQLEAEEAEKEGNEATRIAAQARVAQWQSSSAEAVSRVRSMHADAADARTAAGQAAIDAEAAALRAAQFAPGSCKGGSPRLALSADAHSAAESARAAAAGLEAAWQAEASAAEAEAAQADERRAEAQRNATQLRDEAGIAAQQAQAMRAAGRAVDSAASEAAARSLVHRAKSEVEASKSAPQSAAAARARHKHAQSQLSCIASSMHSHDVDSRKLRTLVDTAVAESSRFDAAAANAGAEAGIAAMRETAAQAQSVQLRGRVQSLQRQIADAEAKGDPYTLDALSAATRRDGGGCRGSRRSSSAASPGRASGHAGCKGCDIGSAAGPRAAASGARVCHAQRSVRLHQHTRRLV